MGSGRYSDEGLSVVALIHTLASCPALLVSVRGGIPVRCNLKDMMRPVRLLNREIRNLEETDLSAVERSVLDACVDVGHGKMELSVVGGVIQGWVVREQTFVFSKTGDGR